MGIGGANRPTVLDVSTPGFHPLSLPPYLCIFLTVSLVPPLFPLRRLHSRMCHVLCSDDHRGPYREAQGHCSDDVSARCQGAVKVAEGTARHELGYPINTNSSIPDGLISSGPHDAPPCTPIGSLHTEIHKRIPVVLPYLWKPVAGEWPLPLGQLQGEIHAIRHEVIPVLHASIKGVPCCTVGNATLEFTGGPHQRVLVCVHSG
mmetsp:Transcript_30725/g.86857  ORF Transcript_30725/g.86857 Transcript_30725/m.86857 type:complete len:204 (+) Transcript_30725:403-1014(+)